MEQIDFHPQLDFEDIEYLLSESQDISIENDELYGLINKLTDSAYPSYEDGFDNRWENFYFPIIRDDQIITIPVWVMEYEKKFYVTVQSVGHFNVSNSNVSNFNVSKDYHEINEIFKEIIKEILRFIPVIKKNEKILEKLIPYDIRTGRIKGRYILDKQFLISQEKKEKILETYQNHILKRLYIEKCSLNEYLNVASICYKSAFPKNSENMNNKEMYMRWADGRDGGMLKIKDWDDKEDFYKWLHSGEWIGSHPFEIVFSWHRHGINLYPPDKDSPYFMLRVTNYDYGKDFIAMVCALIQKDIAFIAKDINDVLDYLVGDTYFSVNKYDEHNFYYDHSNEKEKEYFLHIDWDEIKVVKWK
jgi:hypothetical protein